MNWLNGLCVRLLLRFYTIWYRGEIAKAHEKIDLDVDQIYLGLEEANDAKIKEIGHRFDMIIKNNPDLNPKKFNLPDNIEPLTFYLAEDAIRMLAKRYSKRCLNTKLERYEIQEYGSVLVNGTHRINSDVIYNEISFMTFHTLPGEWKNELWIENLISWLKAAQTKNVTLIPTEAPQ